VDNLPQVPPEKQEKLAAVIKRLYAQIGTIREGILFSLVTLRFTIHHIQVAQMLFKYMLIGKQTLTVNFGVLVAGGFWMPSDEETKLTKGFAFIEFLTPEVIAGRHSIIADSFCACLVCAVSDTHVHNTATHRPEQPYFTCRKHKRLSSTHRATT